MSRRPREQDRLKRGADRLNQYCDICKERVSDIYAHDAAVHDNAGEEDEYDSIDPYTPRFLQ